MASVNILLRTGYKSKDKKYPVVFVIRNKGSHAYIQSGVKLSKTYWDDKKWVKSGSPGITDNNFVNKQLRDTLQDIAGYIDYITLSGEVNYMKASEIKLKYLSRKQKEKYNFNSYFEYIITTKTESTGRLYQNTLNEVQKFHHEILHFYDVNTRFLRDFENWQSKKGSSINNTGIHMRNIRAVFNAAIDDEVIGLELYPFRKFKIKKERTEKRNLTVLELHKLKEADLRGVPSLSRDVFFLMIALIGINLIDLTYLKKENIKDGRLKYTRRKTGQKYDILLEPESKRLIKKLRGSKYLLNLLDRYDNYDSVKKEINKKLKVAAKKAKLSNSKISTYYARHSWATIAANMDISDKIISAALGHETGHRTTSIYIDIYQDMIDKANKKVLNSLF